MGLHFIRSYPGTATAESVREHSFECTGYIPLPTDPSQVMLSSKLTDQGEAVSSTSGLAVEQWGKDYTMK